MERESNGLEEKSRAFKAAYDEARIWLADSGGSAESIARRALATAQRAVPLTPDELALYEEWIKDDD